MYSREKQILENFDKDVCHHCQKTSPFNKTFLTMLQFVELPLQWIKTQHSLDRTLKFSSGINNSISENIEYSEEVSQS